MIFLGRFISWYIYQSLQVSGDYVPTIRRNSRPKHAELINMLRNKRTKENSASSWLYFQDYTGMHGQQNI